MVSRAVEAAWPRAGERAAALARRIESIPPWRVVAGAIVLEWLAVLGLALVVRHNGWIYYQGGDQLWSWTLARELAHGRLLQTPVGYLWSIVLAPFAAVAGPNLVSALPAIVLFDVLVLLPVAMLALYGIGARLGGRLFGYWTLLTWIAVPFIGVKYADAGYHQKYTELQLPQSFGLTAMADFPTMVAVVVMAYFAVRAIHDDGDALDGAAAGLAAGAAIAVKPSAALILLGPPLAFAYRRRLPAIGTFVLGLLPAVAVLALWKERGLGSLPLLSSGLHAPAGLAAVAPVVGLNFHKYFGDLDWHHFLVNLDSIREHFWSVRVLEWLFLGGTIALARRSLGVMLLVAGSLYPFILIKSAYPLTSIDDGSLLRILIPIFPLFVLGIAALPFLLPGLPERVRRPSPRPRWRRRPRLAVLAAALLATAVAPAAAIGAADTAPARPGAVRLWSSHLPVPLVDLDLHAKQTGRSVLLTWRELHPLGGRVFYQVFRDPAPAHEVTCAQGAGAHMCSLAVTSSGLFAGQGARVDRPGPGTWVYRIGVVANWLDDQSYGDVYEVSEPLVVRVR